MILIIRIIDNGDKHKNICHDLSEEPLHLTFKQTLGQECILEQWHNNYFELILTS